MRRSVVTLIAASAVAALVGLAPTASSARGDTAHTPIVHGPGDLAATPCTTYYKTVTLKITDNGVLFNDGAKPACFNLAATATLKITNNAESEATVNFAGDSNVMVIDELWNYQPIGDFFGVGTKLSFSVDELAGSLTTIKVV